MWRIKYFFVTALLLGPVAETSRSYSTAQARPVDRCPLITVSSPDDVVRDGATITFTASISGADPDARYTFLWAVSDGTITSGQGTAAITVDTSGLGYRVVKATVEVGGFPEPCAKSVSYSVAVSAGIACCRPYDEYGDIRLVDEQARLDNFAVALQNAPEARGYIVAYSGRRSRPSEARSRAQRAKMYLMNSRGIEAGRIFVVNGGRHKEMTIELYFVPRGADAPTAKPAVEPGEVHVIRDSRSSIRRRRGE